MLIYRHECLNIDEVKSSLLICEKMKQESGSYDDAASTLVVIRRSKEIGLDSKKGKSRSKFRYCKRNVTTSRKDIKKQNILNSKTRKRKIQVMQQILLKVPKMFSQYQLV